MSTSLRCHHPLLHGGRWRLARPQSRALWAAATPRELAELFDDTRLRGRTEDFLRLVARSVDGVETLLIFDHEAVDLAVAISLPADRDARCAWDWIASSLVGAKPRLIVEPIGPIGLRATPGDPRHRPAKGCED